MGYWRLPQGALPDILPACAERVLLLVAKFKAETFDELFEKTKALPWEDFIPRDGKFWVAKATSIKSKLFSPSILILFPDHVNEFLVHAVKGF